MIRERFYLPWLTGCNWLSSSLLVVTVHAYFTHFSPFVMHVCVFACEKAHINIQRTHVFDVVDFQMSNWQIVDWKFSFVWTATASMCFISSKMCWLICVHSPLLHASSSASKISQTNEWVNMYRIENPWAKQNKNKSMKQQFTDFCLLGFIFFRLFVFFYYLNFAFYYMHLNFEYKCFV